MNNQIIAVAKSHVAQVVIHEGLKLINHVIEYRRQAMQVELDREHMNLQADLCIQKMQQQFDKDIARIKSLTNSYELSLNNISLQSNERSQVLKQIDIQIQNTLKMLASLPVESTLYTQLSTTLQMLIEQQQYMINNLSQYTNEASNMFIKYTDTLNNTP